MNPYPRRSDVNLAQQAKYTPPAYSYPTSMGDSPRANRHHRKRRSPRHKSWYQEGVPINVHVGNRCSPGYYTSIQVTSGDGDRFADLVHETLRMNPQDPLLITFNGYQPWLEQVISTCIDDRYDELTDLNRALQYDDTVKFPERSNKRSTQIPWSFLVDQMNIPDVYWWTFGKDPPQDRPQAVDEIDEYRFRIAAWCCGRRACRFDERVPVVLIFTQDRLPAENVMRDLFFPYFYEDEEYDRPRRDEESVCWTFLRLYWLLTDWQNIIREIERELEEAELNSRGRKLPVKLRTRIMHKQIDRIYELSEYMRFHSRSFKKLLKLRDTMRKGPDDDNDPVWDEMDDAVEDLDQYSYYMDTLKERFLNLIELEFNIENANQSDYSRFLSLLAALYLPITYLTVRLVNAYISIFGISTLTAPAILCLYISIPLLVVSLVFTVFFPWAVQRFQRVWYPANRNKVRLPKSSYTMLAEELPSSADVPRVIAIRDPSLPRQHAARQSHHRRSNSKPRSKSRKRSLSTRGRRRLGVDDKV
ncbi:hypothetical protein E4T42_04528 [Aureobasidium subglaciale]|nr:hypothetical protein E4T42_04528 [Aureobasidium subglaciale]